MTERMRVALEAWPTWAVEWFHERAGIREFDGGLSRPLAEQQAYLETSRRVRASKEDGT